MAAGVEADLEAPAAAEVGAEGTFAETPYTYPSNKTLVLLNNPKSSNLALPDVTYGIQGNNSPGEEDPINHHREPHSPLSWQ